jgi:hypothetical protein
VEFGFSVCVLSPVAGSVSVSGSVFVFFAWCSMLLCVKFDVGMRGI